jgi:hypothetical protein
MAMGKRRRHAKQPSIWVATKDLPRSAAHPFYTRLNQTFDQHDFEGYVEGLCNASMRATPVWVCRRGAVESSGDRKPTAWFHK